MDFILFSPHVTFELVDYGERILLEATATDWRKWLPTDPTSPHWYMALTIFQTLRKTLGRSLQRLGRWPAAEYCSAQISMGRFIKDGDSRPKVQPVRSFLRAASP